MIEGAVAAGAAATSAAFAVSEFGEYVVTGFGVDIEILAARDCIVVSDHEIRCHQCFLGGFKGRGAYNESGLPTISFQADSAVDQRYSFVLEPGQLACRIGVGDSALTVNDSMPWESGPAGQV